MSDIGIALTVPCPGCKMPADSACVDLETGAKVEGVHSNRIYRGYVVAEAIAHNRVVELAAEVERLTGELATLRATDYLVWSNQKGMWWRAGESGYTSLIEEAGRYTLAHAESIVSRATCDGALKHERVNPVTGFHYTSFDEVLVAAPKGIEIEVPF